MLQGHIYTALLKFISAEGQLFHCLNTVPLVFQKYKLVNDNEVIVALVLRANSLIHYQFTNIQTETFMLKTIH